MRYKHIIITGCTGGLGKSLSKLLLNDKNNIIGHIIGRNKDKLDCISINDESFKYICDLSYSIEIDKLCNEIYENIKKFTPQKMILINCVGIIQPICMVENLKYEDIKKSISINLESPINLISNITSISTNLNIDLDIINITSGVIKRPVSTWSMYISTKAAMISFLNTLSKENSHIRIVNLDPGVMDTEMQEYIRNSKSIGFNNVERFIKYKNENMLRNPNDVARKIKYAYIDNWLCEDEYEHIKKYDSKGKIQ